MAIRPGIAFVSALLAIYSLTANADSYGPLREAQHAKVVGMITVMVDSADDDVLHIRASSGNIKRLHVTTAWVFCRLDGQRLGSSLRLDGNIGTRTLEGQQKKFCDDGNEVEVVLIDHGHPVKKEVMDDDGNWVPGSVIQVTTSNLTDPFCTGEKKPRRTCKAVATGYAPL